MIGVVVGILGGMFLPWDEPFIRRVVMGMFFSLALTVPGYPVVRIIVGPFRLVFGNGRRQCVVLMGTPHSRS